MLPEGRAQENLRIISQSNSIEPFIAPLAAGLVFGLVLLILVVWFPWYAQRGSFWMYCCATSGSNGIGKLDTVLATPAADIEREEVIREVEVIRVVPIEVTRVYI